MYYIYADFFWQICIEQIKWESWFVLLFLFSLFIYKSHVKLTVWASCSLAAAGIEGNVLHTARACINLYRYMTEQNYKEYLVFWLILHIWVKSPRRRKGYFYRDFFWTSTDPPKAKKGFRVNKASRPLWKILYHVCRTC